MTLARQYNEILETSPAEHTKLVISELLLIVRCSATPNDDGTVNCTLPNAYVQLLNRDQKRIKEQVINVPVGFMDGAATTFDEIHGLLLVSNFATNNIEDKTMADISCTNVTGSKCLFIPAQYEDEFVNTWSLQTSEKITLQSPKIDIGSSSVDVIDETIDALTALADPDNPTAGLAGAFIADTSTGVVSLTPAGTMMITALQTAIANLQTLKPTETP